MRLLRERSADAVAQTGDPIFHLSERVDEQIILDLVRPNLRDHILQHYQKLVEIIVIERHSKNLVFCETIIYIHMKHSFILHYTTADHSAAIQWIYPNRAGDQVAVNLPHRPIGRYCAPGNAASPTVADMLADRLAPALST
jgi:hypothetical protein